MLVLVVGGVADPHGAGVLVPREVVELGLGQAALAADAVHDLQAPALGLGAVGHEVEEVVGLPVEAQCVQAPQHEAGVADPGVAVVPVALATRRLRERRRGGGHHRAGRRVREALQRQRAALEVGTPRVVGEVAMVEPVLPVVRGPDEPPVRLLVRVRWSHLAPREGEEQVLALLDERAGQRARSLETQPAVRGEQELDRRPLDAAHPLVVAVAGVLPMAPQRAVLEDRLAVEVELHLAVHAPHEPHEDVLGVVVGRRAPVRRGSRLLAVPRPDEERIAHDHPAAPRPPARLEHHRAREVAAGGGHIEAVGRQAEQAGAAVEDGGEHARRVEVGEAHPLDVAVGRDERSGRAVGEEGVVGDRRERTPYGHGVRIQTARLGAHGRRAYCPLFRHPSAGSDRLCQSERR